LQEKFVDTVEETTRLVDRLFLDTQSLDQAFSKACSFQRQSLWSLSAESETPLGFAQHLFFLKIGGFYPPIHFLSLATLVNKGGLCPPFRGKRC